MATARLQCADKHLDLSCANIMGILNVTPDSFSDGGQLHANNAVSISQVLVRAEAMIKAGASILDVGGESTRPGAALVSTQQELDRVMPVIAALKTRFDAVISIDTSTANVMQEAAAAGAGLINDVRALQKEGALQAAADTALPICLMHMQGQPQGMQNNPQYGDVISEVSSFFKQRIDACEAQGIEKNRLLLDPGFGFGKTLAHNLQLLNALAQLKKEGFPLLVGMSRKSMIDDVLHRKVDQRMPASIALAVMAVERGAKIIRVHDVQETVDAVRMAEAVLAVKK